MKKKYIYDLIFFINKHLQFSLDIKIVLKRLLIKQLLCPVFRLTNKTRRILKHVF